MTVRDIDLMYQTMLAELGQRTFDAQFVADFPSRGRFVTVKVKGREYWYFDTPTADGDKRSYVGPKADAAITGRVARFREIKASEKQNRKLVVSLIRDAGMSAPDRFQGDVVKALADAGLFRLRAVLVGSAAFGCYSGVLGVRLPLSAIMTGDADIAQDFAISTEVMDSMPPILDLLRSVDPTFRPIPHHGDRAKVAAFENANRYRVEFLTGNRGSDEFLGKPATMPALGGAAAEPLRFLDFLLVDPIRTVMLHRSGVSVVVPSPERYAVHKLIVATRRQADDHGKRTKDLYQAALLFEAMQQTRRHEDVRDAYGEAWDRGPSWQEAILSGIGMMPKSGRMALAACVGVSLDGFVP